VNAKPFLIGFLAVVACLVAASIYFVVTVDKANKEILAVASPDRKYKTVKLTVSGDKPIPFCVDTISIFLSVYPNSFAASEGNYEVYAAPCAAPDRRSGMPKIEWQSDSAVQITYAPGSDKPKARMKDHDGSLFVRVTFVKQ
jgi:hypothetical protein